jgi:endonuclease/exonuclease/phosphatase family metal-dependent hydrolase
MDSLVCYCLHLDPHFLGVDGRVKQMKEVLDDVKKHVGKNMIPIVAGDLNTACTGSGRLNPVLSPDYKSRIGTLGTSEAQYFQQTIIENSGLYDPFDKDVDVTYVGNWGFFAAKLIWVLTTSKLKVVNKEVGDPKKNDYSDHCYVLVDYAI